MYKKYFEEFYLPKDELKSVICRMLSELSRDAPKQVDTRFIELVDANDDLEKMLSNVINSVPILKARENDYIDVLTVGQVAGVVATTLRGLLLASKLEDSSVKLVPAMFASLFLALRYMYAAEIIENDLGQDLKYDYEKLLDVLCNQFTRVEGRNRYLVEIAAEEEIARVVTLDKIGGEYLALVEKFETAVEDHIKVALPEMIVESLVRALLEGCAANLGHITKMLRPSTHISPIDARKDIEEILKFGRQRTSERLGIRRGGARESDKFKWTPECQREFYLTVQNLPTIEGRPMWDYGLDALNKADFNYKFIDYLNTETAFKDVPESLFREAVRVWRKYNTSFNNPEPKEKPKAFAMKHALHLLGYSAITFSTMKRYFSKGKKLANTTT